MSASIPRGVRGAGARARVRLCAHADRAQPVHALVRSSATTAAQLPQLLPHHDLWHVAAAPFWIAGLLGRRAGTRLALWAAGAWPWNCLAPDRLVSGCRASAQSTTADWVVEGAHMAERCGLFVIIALGESILITGASFAESRLDPRDLSPHSLVAFVGSVAMWTVYFNIGAERSSAAIANVRRSRRARAQRLYLSAYPDRRRHHCRCRRATSSCCIIPDGHDGHTGMATAARDPRRPCALSDRQHAVQAAVGDQHAAVASGRVLRSLALLVPAVGDHDPAWCCRPARPRS